MAAVSEGYQFEAETKTVEVLLLPKKIKVLFQLNTSDKVRSVKEKILSQNNIPYPIKYMIVLISLHGDRIVLDDNLAMSHYIDYLRHGSLEVTLKSLEIERPPRPVKLQTFGITLK
ncbi:uncharacterized protein LOC106055286 [Biomphalaria glabrata]|uniref:Uncharacterized protein LOC106055286 n=1 Tax=Biomphalaria glabrata TaxID=6526 RepID=A0A9U8DZ58_BIOGL|nr:uncharacterized protein LOC106055286 [Biomphalaria glabrata]XP_055867590.1 uncharacterized protein LOC106055286 [Biomphalaria glabrata]XP_055867592.1 uncharacterized protein LOC106055286 [Biomphalaria glabrata]